MPVRHAAIRRSFSRMYPVPVHARLAGRCLRRWTLTHGGRPKGGYPMSRVVLCLVLVGALALAAPMSAVICTIDAVPAASLLLPYFEVDLSNPNGLTTLFSLNNAAASAAL